MSDRTYPHSQPPQTNTCSNISPSRNITSAASSHGTIRTDNHQLLSLLREKNQDRSQKTEEREPGALVNPNDSNRNLTNPIIVATDENDRIATSRPSSTERLVDDIYPHKSLLHASNPPSSPLSSASTKNRSSRLNSVRPVSNLSQVESNNFDSSLLIDSLEVENKTAHAPEATSKPSGSTNQVPPLDLNQVNNSQAFDSVLNTANTAQDKGEPSASLASTSDNPETLHTGGFLHAIVSQSEAQKENLDRESLNASPPHVVNPSARSHLSNSRALSVSVVSEGEGTSDTKRSIRSVNSTEQEKDRSKTVTENNNLDEDLEDQDTLRSVRLNPRLNSVAPTPGHSAPITGRQTYAVPSPVSNEVPIIDSLNFSARENTADGVPLPAKASSSPRPSAKQRSSRDPSATQRSTSSVYTVVNPAIQAAQGTSAQTQRSFRDSLEQSNINIDTNEVNEIPYSERRLKSNERKSAVSFKEPDTQTKAFEDPGTRTDSPNNIEPDWETPRVEDRVSTPHPSPPPKSPSKHRFTPTKGPWEKEETEQGRNKSPETLKSPEKSQERRISPTPVDHRPTSVKSTRKSPLPVEQEERNLESAPIPAISRGNTENRTVRTDSLPTVKRVYVDSPTFTKEEEEEYRFVESRLGEIQDDVEDTLRRLDKETEKQRNIRKKLERQMATMYAPAYQDQPNGQSYGGTGYNQGQMNRNREDDRGAYADNYRRESYGEQRRDNMGSYSNVRAMNDNRSYGEPQRENMGSYPNLRNDDRMSHNDNRQDNMGSYANVRRDVDPRYDNMGSYGNIRRDVDPRQDNMGSYGNLRDDVDPRQHNMGSYGNYRGDVDPRQDRVPRGYDRQDNMGSYANQRLDNDPRQENMGSNANLRRDNERMPYGEQRRDYMGSYGDLGRVDNQDQYGQNYSPEKRDMRRGDDRYEDRDSRMNRYEDRNQQDYGAPRPHVMNGSYETHDDELKREFEYQQTLKNRIEESGRRDNEVLIPRLPMNSESFRDSLDEEGYVEWRNPPPNPYAHEGGRVSEGGMPQQEGYRNSRQEEELPEFMDRNDTDRMEIVHPREPTYDFVENNKYDYGKPPERSYRELKHIKEEEVKKLDHYFVHPKPSPKKNRHVDKSGHKSAPSKFQQTHSPIEEVDPDNPAQALWAKRSAALKRRDGDKKSKKTKPLQRFDSDTRIMRPPPPYLSQGTAHNHQSAVTYGTPTHSEGDNRIARPSPPYLMQGTAHNHQSAVTYGSTRNHHLEPLINRPSPPLHNPRKARSEPSYNPENHTTLFRKPHELKPITQEIVTEDGQRISVDINLKVVSPPPSGGPPTVHAEVMPNRRPTGQQYQLDDGGVDSNQQGQNQYYDPYLRNHYYYDPTQTQYGQHNNQENVAPVTTENATQSGYQAHSYRDFSPTNPYPKVPPIAVTEEELERQLADMEGDGYAAMYKREREKPKDAAPWYKIYNLHDYRRMKQEAELHRGPLGPDLDNETYKEKLEKRQKQFEYARTVMARNRQELEGKMPKQKPKKSEMENSKRKAAIDYSKNVPKPTVKPRPNQYNSYEVAAQLSPVSKPNKSAPTTSQSPQTVDVIDIQKLQQRHEQEKQNVAMIRQNMETVPQKA